MEVKTESEQMDGNCRQQEENNPAKGRDSANVGLDHGGLPSADLFARRLMLHVILLRACLCLLACYDVLCRVVVCMMYDELVSSRQIEESISILNFFPPNRGVDFYFEFLPQQLVQQLDTTSCSSPHSINNQ